MHAHSPRSWWSSSPRWLHPVASATRSSPWLRAPSGGGRRARRAALSLLTALAVVGPRVPVARSAEWATDDGLAVTLDDATGAPVGVTVGAADLPRPAGGTAGLAFREYVRNPVGAGVPRLSLSFEEESGDWVSAAMENWAVAEPYAERLTGEAAGGTGFLRIGDGTKPGAGMAATGRVPVGPDEVFTLSWQARCPDVAMSYILCLRFYDAGGRDVTETTAAPGGWQYSPYSKAHYRTDLRNTKPDTWEPFVCEGTAPAGAAAMGLSLRVYRDGALQADIDDLRVVVSPSRWSTLQPVEGRVTRTAEGLRQEAHAAEAGLRFVVDYTSPGGRLQAAVQVAATDPDRARRCLRLVYRLPVALAGWTWSGDPRLERNIEQTGLYENPVSVAGHPLSRYPLASVHDGRVGLAMAVPADIPALQSLSADAGGLQMAADLGLSPEAPRAGSTVGLVLCRHAPEWGFRAALERYYVFSPELFEVRTRTHGAWLYPSPDLAMPDAQDFGFAFHECGEAGNEVRAFCRERGIALLRYIEPWGVRQTFPAAQTPADLPPYEDRLAQVEGWAQGPPTDDRWIGVPRSLMARALLNSMLTGPDGRGAFQVDKYTHWAHWWQLNTDPDLPSPNRAGVTFEYEVEPALELADGIYVDSVSFWPTVFDDHDPLHLAGADCPLSFSLETGTPVVSSAWSRDEFLASLHERVKARGKLLMLNLFPPATRLYGRFGDITGCELAGPQDDASALEQRVYAYHRPLTNLLQWRFAVLNRVPAMTPDQMREYLENQLLYGFDPGISTAGGGTEEGYAGMHRYFRVAELYERDRALFRQYTPIFAALDAAGWEPVTRARAERTEVLVERFGRPGGPLYLTVHNAGPEAAQVRLSLEGKWWREALGAEHLAATELLSGASLPVTSDPASVQLDLGPRRTAVLRLQPAGAPTP